MPENVILANSLNNAYKYYNKMNSNLNVDFSKIKKKSSQDTSKVDLTNTTAQTNDLERYSNPYQSSYSESRRGGVAGFFGGKNQSFSITDSVLGSTVYSESTKTNPWENVLTGVNRLTDWMGDSTLARVAKTVVAPLSPLSPLSPLGLVPSLITGKTLTDNKERKEGAMYNDMWNTLANYRNRFNSGKI